MGNITIKKLIICFLVLSMLFCGCKDTRENSICEQTFFEYVFYTGTDGKNTVIWNEEVYKFDKVTPIQEDFEKIKPDMDFLQVVELVGFYTEYPLYSGIIVTKYECADGQKYSIQWSQNLASQNADEMVVVDVTSEK